MLRLPFGIGGRVLGLRGVPRVAAFLSRRLPARPVRGRTAGYACEWEECAADYREGMALATEPGGLARLGRARGRKKTKWRDGGGGR